MNGVEIFFLILLLIVSLTLIYGEKDKDSMVHEVAIGIVMFVSTLIWVYFQLQWLFWIIILTFSFWNIQRLRNLEEKKKQDNVNHLLMEEERIKKDNLKKLYDEKLKKVEAIQNKNKQLHEEIKTLKPIVSTLSIYDDDFLEQQPKVLEYVEEVINLGRI